MRITIAFLLPLLLFACNNSISKEERQLIDINIRLHNQNAALEYRLAYNDEESAFKIEHFNWPDSTRKRISKMHMELFTHKYFENKETDISRDTALTFEKYLSWCKATGSDPKEAYKFLD